MEPGGEDKGACFIEFKSRRSHRIRARSKIRVSRTRFHRRSRALQGAGRRECGDRGNRFASNQYLSPRRRRGEDRAPPRRSNCLVAASRVGGSGGMTVLRMDNGLIVVDDLNAAIAFFAERGLE